jgi:subtilisin-like proprotein convertase family protein
VNLNSDAASVSEGGGVVVVTATLDAPSGRTVTVNYGASNLTAVAGSDYTATSGVLTFTAGVTEETFSVPILNDSIYELGETFRVTLSSPANANLGALSQMTVTITNNDTAPNVQFTEAISSVLESTAKYTATVKLTGNTAVTATVPYSVIAGTATAGSDYTASNGTLTFAPGTTQRTVVITIINDASDENDETLTIDLGSPNHATLGANDINTLTIQDNDGPPSVQLNASQSAVAEGAGVITLTVSLNYTSGFTTSVQYSSTNGTAISGVDYVGRVGTLTFPPNTASRPLTFTLTNDTVVESNKTFSVTISNPISATLGSPSNTVVTIANDDARAGCVIYYSTDVPKNIPDNSTIGITSTLTLPLPGVIITDVSVRIEALAHSYIGDLVVTLVGPNGQSITLLNRNGNGPNLSFTVFNDAYPVLSGDPPFTGNFRPNTGLPALGNFNGQRTGGTWRLVVKDLAGGDTGQIQRWGLELCGTMTHQLFLPLIRR